MKKILNVHITNMKNTEIINWRKVSIALSGNPEGVRSTYSGHKYKQQVDELKEFAEDWLKRNQKAGSAKNVVLKVF